MSLFLQFTNSPHLLHSSTSHIKLSFEDGPTDLQSLMDGWTINGINNEEACMVILHSDKILAESNAQAPEMKMMIMMSGVTHHFSFKCI